MRTNDMIYQAAIAHQTDLRRQASQRNRSAYRDSGRSEWSRLFSLASGRKASAKTATGPSASGVAISV